MFDIIRVSSKAKAFEELGADASAHGQNIAPESFNFSKFYFLDDVKGKIAKVANLDEAAKFRNKGVLVLPGEYSEDIGLMKKFAEGKSAFLIDLGRITETYGFRRAVEMAKMRRFLRICVKYEVPFALASFAKDEFSIRTSRELCHIATLVGLNTGQAKFGLERLKQYIE